MPSLPEWQLQKNAGDQVAVNLDSTSPYWMTWLPMEKMLAQTDFFFFLICAHSEWDVFFPACFYTLKFQTNRFGETFFCIYVLLHLNTLVWESDDIFANHHHHVIRVFINKIREIAWQHLIECAQGSWWTCENGQESSVLVVLLWTEDSPAMWQLCFIKGKKKNYIFKRHRPHSMQKNCRQQCVTVAYWCPTTCHAQEKPQKNQ